MIWTDLIAFVVLGIVIATLIVSLIILNAQKSRLATKLLQTTIEKMTALNMLEDALSEKESNNIEQTDGFLKFVSDSRNWAFDYIEEVQAGLAKFQASVKPHLDYINKYGSIIDNPVQGSIDKISEAYVELEKLMPENDKQV